LESNRRLGLGRFFTAEDFAKKNIVSFSQALASLPSVEVSHGLGAFSRAVGPVGLRFEPAQRRRTTDVVGTLWVDRNSGQLRVLEYVYVGLPPELDAEHVGGRLQFRRLSTGAWIVDNWYIRMPRVETVDVSGRAITRQRSMTRVVGYVDRGGDAVLVTTLDTVPRRAVVRGSLFDSTTMQPLVGATVRLDSVAQATTVSDSAGRFVIQHDSGGWQTLTARHRKLGLITDSSQRTVPLSIGDTIAIAFCDLPPQRAWVIDAFGSNNPDRSTPLATLRFVLSAGAARWIDVSIPNP
jgi:hypothetical protein